MPLKLSLIISISSALILSLNIFFISCNNKIANVHDEEPFIAEEQLPEPEPELSEAQILLLRLEYYREQAALIAASMDEDQLIAQCLLTGLGSNTSLSSSLHNMLSEIPAGGIMLFRYNLASEKEDISSFIQDCVSLIEEKSGITPFIAVDHEGGLVQRLMQGYIRLPAALHFWERANEEGWEAALSGLESLAGSSAMEIRETGITMNLAPVVEILNPDNRIFLDTRSYGPDPEFVKMAASAFIRGMESAGIASVLKHFPGNSAQDPHYENSIIMAGYLELAGMTEPFRGIIPDLHPAAIMISHSIVRAIDPDTNSSLSPFIISWLREDMGFRGIVLSDDYNMRAVSSRGISAENAAVLALNAGIDMIMCWPHNINSVHNAILDALNDNRLPRERLVDAAERILAQKIRYGLISMDKIR